MKKKRRIIPCVVLLIILCCVATVMVKHGGFRLIADVCQNRGLAYFEKRDYDKAITYYTWALRLDSGYALAYQNRGNAYLEKGDYDTAIDDYTEALRLESENETIYLDRGFAYSEKGDYDEAIDDYTEALYLDSSYTRAYLNRGNAYLDKGDYDRAINDYTETLYLDSEIDVAYLYRGFAYFYKGDYDKAIDDYTEALRLDRRYTRAYQSRGYAYFEKGDYSNARSDFEQVLRLDPGNEEALENLAILKKMDYAAPKPVAAVTPAPPPPAAATSPAAPTGSTPKPTAATTPPASAPAVTPPAPTPAAAPAAVPASVTEESRMRAAIVAAARKYQGARYVYGAMNPPSSFDCSGLVGQAYKDGANYTTPRSSTEIYNQGYKVNAADLKPGDVVVYTTDGKGNPSHVSIWVDNTTFIHAVSTGSPTGVMVASLTSSWSSKIIGYRSFFSSGKLKPKSKALTTSLPITDFYLSITNRAQTETDPLSAAVNSAMRFTLYNETDRTETYVLYFYKTGTSRTGAESQELRINAGASGVSEFYPMKETGSYTLEVREKGGDAPLLEHIWNVIE